MHTHLKQWSADAAAPREQLGVRCLAQGSHLSRGQFLLEPRFEPTTSGYKSKALSIRPRLPHRTTTGSAPSYLHLLMTIYIPSRSLRSASEQRLVVPSQRGTKSRSRTFLTIFKRHLKTHLFYLHLTTSS